MKKEREKLKMYKMVHFIDDIYEKQCLHYPELIVKRWKADYHLLNFCCWLLWVLWLLWLLWVNNRMFFLYELKTHQLFYLMLRNQSFSKAVMYFRNSPKGKFITKVRWTAHCRKTSKENKCFVYGIQ